MVEFFEERRGRLHGFRFRDPLDYKSCAPGEDPSSSDQLLGVGDGETAVFPLVKTYGNDEDTIYSRPISLPVIDGLKVEMGGILQLREQEYQFADGNIIFLPNSIPPTGEPIRAGFEFDVPMRFDTDRLDINLSQFEASAIPSIPMVEIVP